MKFSALLLILLLAVPLLFKSWTVVNYWTHYDYYVNVLCENKDNPMEGCNGQCALKKELKKAESQKDEAQVPMDWVSQYGVSVFEVSGILHWNFLQWMNNPVFFTMENLWLKRFFLQSLDHPPC